MAKKRLDVSAMMGRIVLVDRVYIRMRNYTKDAGNSVYKQWGTYAGTGRPGWVTGERWLQQGLSYWGYLEDTPPEWSEKGKRTHCLLVCYWPTMKSVFVPLDGYRLADEYTKPYSPESRWLTGHRKSMRWIMDKWPRDARGRWKKREHADSSQERKEA